MRRRSVGNRTTSWCLSLAVFQAAVFAAEQPGSLIQALEARGLAADACVAFDFTNSTEPKLAAPGFALHGVFTRDGRAYLPDGSTVEANAPRIAKWPAGTGLILEEGSRNLLARSASGPTMDGAAFTALKGATLSVVADELLGDAGCLKVETAGKAVGEGFSITTKSDVPAGRSVCGSLRLRGTGLLCVRLLDVTNYVPGGALSIRLTPEWRRYVVPPVALAAAGSQAIRLTVATADSEACVFQMAMPQVEPLHYATSWMPGGEERGVESMRYPLTDPAWRLEEGTIVMWVALPWDDGMIIKPWGNYFLHLDNGPQFSWTNYNSLAVGNGKPMVRGGNVYDGGRHFLAVSVSPSRKIACHNGVCAESAEGQAFLAKPKAMGLVRFDDQRAGHGDFIAEQMVILRRALGKEDLEALHEATK